MMGFGTGFGGGMWLLWLLLIGLIVWAVVSVNGKRTGQDSRQDVDPVDVLKKRLARGEIGREEYRRLRDEIGR